MDWGCTWIWDGSEGAGGGGLLTLGAEEDGLEGLLDHDDDFAVPIRPIFYSVQTIICLGLNSAD